MIQSGSRTLRALAFAALALAGGCSELTISAPTDPAAPLFEVESANTAWFPYWAGFYVDRDGRVYSWDRSDDFDRTLGEDVLTPEQLARKYSRKRELVKNLAAGEALQRYGLVSDAASASLAERKGTCADAGIQKFSAWVYDAPSNTYHRVLLHQRGDESTTRRSDAARMLWRWLDEVTRNGPPADTFCDAYPND